MTTPSKIVSGIIIGIIVLVGCMSRGIKVPVTTADYAKTSAMITLPEKNSGGSGVILTSNTSMSTVLTNKHVCQLIQNGGLVITDQGEYPVHSFRVYKRHDLCLVTVLANLHTSNKLADVPPTIYSNITIAGHPALMPTMVTTGHFANKMIISLMVGVQKCDGTESNDEQLMCLITGKKPLIQAHQAVPVTATIMPGSSGSGAFNDKGEIAGLVFAGSGDLSYGLLVPYEYVKDFLTHTDRYQEQYPKKDTKQQNFFADVFRLEKVCANYPKNCKHIALLGLAHD
jgi:S1-C subfamily serine protease